LFWAACLASDCSMPNEDRSLQTLRIQVEYGLPGGGGLLQLSGGCANRIWLMSANSFIQATCPNTESVWPLKILYHISQVFFRNMWRTKTDRQPYNQQEYTLCCSNCYKTVQCLSSTYFDGHTAEYDSGVWERCTQYRPEFEVRLRTKNHHSWGLRRTPAMGSSTSNSWSTIYGHPMA